MKWEDSDDNNTQIKTYQIQLHVNRLIGCDLCKNKRVTSLCVVLTCMKYYQEKFVYLIWTIWNKNVDIWFSVYNMFLK
jgi:hypothetical protein